MTAIGNSRERAGTDTIFHYREMVVTRRHAARTCARAKQVTISDAGATGKRCGFRFTFNIDNNDKHPDCPTPEGVSYYTPATAAASPVPHSLEQSGLGEHVEASLLASLVNHEFWFGSRRASQTGQVVAMLQPDDLDFDSNLWPNEDRYMFGSFSCRFYCWLTPLDGLMVY